MLILSLRTIISRKHEGPSPLEAFNDLGRSLALLLFLTIDAYGCRSNANAERKDWINASEPLLALRSRWQLEIGSVVPRDDVWSGHCGLDLHQAIVF